MAWLPQQMLFFISRLILLTLLRFVFQTAAIRTTTNILKTLPSSHSSVLNKTERPCISTHWAFYRNIATGMFLQCVWVEKNHIWVHSVGQGLRQMENRQHGSISTDI